MVTPVGKRLKKHAVTVYLGAKAKGRDGAALSVETADGNAIKLEADNVTIGREPSTEGSGLENTAVDMDGRFVQTDIAAPRR